MRKLASLNVLMGAKLTGNALRSSGIASRPVFTLTHCGRWLLWPAFCNSLGKNEMHDVASKVQWHEPTLGKRAGFGKWGRVKTPYDLFMESEGIPCFRDIGISKVQHLPLAPWKRLGG